MRTRHVIGVAAAAVALAAGLAAGAQRAATHTVIMEAVGFQPPSLTVNAGDTVVWTNKDPFPHTATAQDKSFDSGEIAAGKSWKLVAKKKGTFAYVCTYHPTMKATLVVR
ncbi:MAG TPA: cupredoxin family copper-binding protein [Burkholderiales bacterium]|nr:cupredoxin family copper-binding protein [Burkholderiales bacterium]